MHSCLVSKPERRGKRSIPVGARVPASERTRQKLDELLTQGVADADARAELLKLAVRIVEEALEAEVAEAVGREDYENGAVPGGGYRSGYRRGRVSVGLFGGQHAAGDAQCAPIDGARLPSRQSA